MKIVLKDGDIVTYEVFGPSIEASLIVNVLYNKATDGDKTIETNRAKTRVRVPGDFNILKVTRKEKTLWERKS